LGLLHFIAISGRNPQAGLAMNQSCDLIGIKGLDRRDA
jgi:hypothetical protein